MEIGQIIEGNVNRFFGLNQDISEQRMRICKRCPLFKIKFGEAICNNKLYYDVNTGDISTTPKDGYKNGCGCILKSKTAATDARCPVNKW